MITLLLRITIASSIVILLSAFTVHILPIEYDLYGDPVDGRFSIGDQRKPLLFGFPLGNSTSHFIITTSSRVGSNNPELKSTQYLKGDLHIKKGYGSWSSKISYTFSNLLIEQSLTPLNSNFEEVDTNKGGQYYRIVYRITNESDHDQKITFDLLMDPMIHGSDDPVGYKGNEKISLGKIFQGEEIPSTISFKNSANKHVEFNQADKGVGIPPSSLCVSSWTYLVNIMRFTQITNTDASNDSAIMYEWENLTIPSKGEIVIGIVVGSKEIQSIQLQHTNSETPLAINVLFDRGKHELTPQSKKELEDFIKKNNVYKGILIEGFTDAEGDELKNLKLSEQRIYAVSTLLQMCGVPTEKLLSKSHGEFYANTYASDMESTQNERRVRVSLW